MKDIRTLAKGVAINNKTVIGNVVFDDDKRIYTINGVEMDSFNLGLYIGQTDADCNRLFEFDIIEYRESELFVIVWSPKYSSFRRVSIGGAWANMSDLNDFEIDDFSLTESRFTGNSLYDDVYINSDARRNVLKQYYDYVEEPKSYKIMRSGEPDNYKFMFGNMIIDDDKRYNFCTTSGISGTLYITKCEKSSNINGYLYEYIERSIILDTIEIGKIKCDYNFVEFKYIALITND